MVYLFGGASSYLMTGSISMLLGRVVLSHRDGTLGGEIVKSYMVFFIIAWIAAYMTGNWWSAGAVVFAYGAGYMSAKDGLH